MASNAFSVGIDCSDTLSEHLLMNDKHWNLFVERIELLFEKYESVEIKTMGFSQNWKELLQHDA